MTNAEVPVLENAPLHQIANSLADAASSIMPCRYILPIEDKQWNHKNNIQTAVVADLQLILKGILITNRNGIYQVHTTI